MALHIKPPVIFGRSLLRFMSTTAAFLCYVIRSLRGSFLRYRHRNLRSLHHVVHLSVFYLPIIHKHTHTYTREVRVDSNE
ncbi:hypothetical protein BJV82DRAFT_594059 [Fennellomyces sp. T-0311]|nr:hypothetical protein BJV82DRAFT_594059 [Fennellomyces sp. T-0311]